MKTVWHWNNIGKMVLVLIVAAILASFVSALLPPSIGFIFGFGIGFGVVMLCMAKWEMWHFE